MTPAGIEPATFRFVAQNLNHCATAVPFMTDTFRNLRFGIDDSIDIIDSIDDSIDIIDSIDDSFRPFFLKCYFLNHLTPNDPYSGSTTPLTSKRCILCIYSTNTGTEYFKSFIHCPFFFSSKCSLFHNSNVIGSRFIHILCTECAKLKKNNSGAKRLKIAEVKN